MEIISPILKTSFILSHVFVFVVASSKTPLTALGDDEGNFVWSSFGSVARFQITIYEAKEFNSNWKLLSHHAQGSWEDLKTTIHAFRDNTNDKSAFARPTNFTQIWNCKRDSTWKKGSFWRMECPKGYVSVGDVVYPRNDLKAPPTKLFDKFHCVRADLTEACRGWGYKIWDNGNSIARRPASVWPPTPESTGFSEFFYTHTQLEATPKVTPHCLKRSAFNEL